MIQHVFSVAAQSSTIDQETSNLSLYNVLDRLTVHAVPFPAITDPPMGLPFPCTVVTLWYNGGTSDEETKQRLALLAPDGHQFNPYDAPLVVKAGQTHRLVAKVSQLPFFGEGRYWFVISLLKGSTWQTVARLPFTLEIANEASAASQ